MIAEAKKTNLRIIVADCSLSIVKKLKKFEESSPSGRLHREDGRLPLEEGKKVDLWFTGKIIPQNRNTQYTYEEINGFPLEIYTEDEGMKMRIVATEVSTSPPEAENFKLEIPKEYTETDLSKLADLVAKKPN